MKISNETLMAIVTKAFNRYCSVNQWANLQKELNRIATTYDLTLEQRKFLSDAVEE